jgi:hypothetical protein
MIIQASKVEVTREEWECFSFTPDSIISDVNIGITEILMTTHHPVIAQERIYDFLETYKMYGFSDSEGDIAATNAINAYYNSNISRWEYLKKQF